MTQIATPAISLRAATMRFATKYGARFTARTEATLDVNPGEFVTVFGPTVCGKSTTRSLISGGL